MRVIIFNDKNNFDGCLNKINDNRKKGNKRFWRLELYQKFLFKKLKSILPKSDNINLVRNIIYTGEYNSKLLNKVKRYCKTEIKEIDKFIDREEKLLAEVNGRNIEQKLKKRISEHVKFVKSVFANRKKGILRTLDKQKRNSEGQKRFFERFDKVPLTEIKTTPLKHAQGIIYQKGVDVLLATDMVHLANSNSYDVALILGGDADLIESIKLVKNNLKKIIVIAAYYNSEDLLKSSISKDLIKEADFFINLKDLSEKEIGKISELRKIKKDEK